MVKCTCAEDSPVQIQSPAHCNVIGCSMTAPPPVLSPSSILPPPSSYCAFTPARKKFGARSKVLATSPFHPCLKLQQVVNRVKSVNSLYFQTTRNLCGTDLPCFKWRLSLTLRLSCCRISRCGIRSRQFGRRCFSVS